MNTYLSLEGVSFTYQDGREALSDISLAIAQGERVSLVGPNGAGKTTLLLQLNGIRRGTGRIKIGGEELTDRTIRSIRRRVGLIFQDPNDQLFCPTVEEDVAFGPLHFDKTRDEIEHIVDNSLRKVEMEDAAKRLTHHLSLGERRRISIACVLACNPEVLAFDEPSASLDPRRRRELIDFIRSTDKTVLVATHDLELALSTCSRCILMDGGKIVADGATRDILGNAELLQKHDLEPPLSIKTI
jgi:energy-coupling factor transporter ATP-binding protein EcfA2